jgi:hypothetical protein
LFNFLREMRYEKTFTFYCHFAFFTAIDSNAQMNPFTAKDGYSAALTKAEGSLTSPELLLIMTGSADQGQIPISPDFDFETGEAMLWIYVFQESDQSAFRAYVVVKIPVIGFQATEIPFDQIVPMLPVQPKGKVPNDDWVDSDEMMEEFLTESNVQEYLADGNVPEIYFIGLFNIAENPLLPNDTYWAMTLMDNNLPLTCALNAYTKEVSCGIQLSDVVPFTARTAYAAAEEKAVEKGLLEPETLAVLTMKTGIEDLPIKNKFDFNAGTASYWVYLFREENNPNKMAAFVAWSDNLGGFLMQDMDVDLVLELMPISPEAPLEDVNWVDSDYMISVFNQHQYFIDFMAEHPDPWTFVIGVFTNEDNPQMEPFKSYWGIAIVDDQASRDSLACVMSLETEEITCGTVLSTFDEEQSDLRIYPNPADNMINLKYYAFTNETRISIVNSAGFEVFRTVESKSVGENIFRYDIQKLSNGSYYVKVQSGKHVNVIPLRIIH